MQSQGNEKAPASLSLKRFTWFLTLCFSLALGSSPGNGSARAEAITDLTPPIVQTRSGYVSGIIDNDTFAYLGIPFAAPPVRGNRWRLPVREKSWGGVRAADKLSNACPQPLPPDNLYGLTSCNEDCLYLNIWTPRARQGDSLPVMFWLHGGGYIGGSASQALYNGVGLANNGVILVTANYRIGPLGFLVTQKLYDSQGQAGNYGLFDTLAALEWVRDNIEKFGGDPGNVTIFGESSGACSVSLLQITPQAKGLFHKAIAMSGTLSSTKYVLNLSSSWAQAAQNGLALENALHAATIQKMRQFSFGEIIEATVNNNLCFGPVMDGQILSMDPRDTPFVSQNAPMIIGTVMDEGSLFIYEYNITTLPDYEQSLKLWFGDNASIVQSYYPATTDEEAVFQAVTVHGLAGMQEPIRHTARGASLSVPVYRYFYTHTDPTEAGAYLGCFHGSELAYVFGNLNPEEGYGPADTAFSDKLMELWTNFAKTGIPQATGLPTWSEFSISQENTFHLNGPNDFALTTGLSFDQECDLFEAIAPRVEPDYPVVSP